MNELSHAEQNKSDDDLYRALIEAQHYANASFVGGKKKRSKKQCWKRTIFIRQPTLLTSVGSRR